MTIDVLMPALSPTMTEGTLSKWLVKEGDEISSGDIIAEVETDKAAMEVETIEDGIMGKILVAAGTDNVQVNDLIAIILEDGEDASALDGTSSAPKAASAPQAAEAPVMAPAQAAVPTMVSSQNQLEGAVDHGMRYEGSAVSFDAPDDMDVSSAPTKTLTVREALRDAMAEEMRADDSVFVMGEEVAQYQGAYKVTQGLLDEFGPRRVIDTPITEYGFAGVGTGAAFAGLKPVVEFMTFNFAMQAIDHIINSAAKTRYMSGGQIACPIVFRGPNGAASRVGAQHSQNYASWYAHVPGLKVIAPYSAADAKGLLRAAIQDPNPVVFLENELMYGQSFDVPDVDDYVLPIGKARVCREGTDVTLVSYSIAVGVALDAAEKLAAEGISAEVIDLRTIRPLDIDTVIASVQKTNRCVVVEEGWPTCSVGSEISAQLMEKAFDYLDAPVTRVNDVDVPLPYANNLEKLALVTSAQAIAAAKAVCYKD